MTGALPDGWALTTLGQIGRYLNGRAFKTSEWSERGRIIIRIQDLTGSGDSPNRYEGEVEPRYEVCAGDFLISWAATLGAYIWRGPDAVLNQHIFKVESHIDQRFHYWLVTAILDDLRRQAHGSGMVHITKGRFEATPVALPPLAEQCRIVAALEEHLSELDAAVAGLERARANTTRMEASLLLDVSRGASRDFAHIDLSPEALWPVPSNWTWTRIGEVGDVLLGRQRAPQYLTGRFSRPYLRVANVGDDVLHLDDIKEMDFEAAHFAKYALRPGDILVSEGQSPELVGQSAIYRGGIEGLCFQKTLHRFRARADLVLPEFAQLVFRGYVKAGVFMRFASLTVNIAHLTLERFIAVPFPLPPLAEQARIVERVTRQLDELRAVRRDIDTQLTRAARLRQAILQAAFKGKLVPQDPTDEPATVLLERSDTGRLPAGTAARARAKTKSTRRKSRR